MISWPNLRRLTALTASSGLAWIRPTTLRVAGSAVEAQQQVGAGQLEEVHAVALDDLAHVHQLAQQEAGRGGGQPISASPALAAAR
jgi:hypothetical protein